MAGKVRPILWTLCAVWATVGAILVETPQELLRAARGKSVTLPCSYSTAVSTREGFIQWDKLLRSHTEKVVIWTFSTQHYIYGDLFENRVNLSGNAKQSDASITISQLTMDDNGTYECSVSLLEDLDGTSKARVRLLVLVPPSKPDCGIKGETVIGNDIQLSCRSKEGSPEPQYSWKSFNLLNQPRADPPGMGQTLSLKNISADTSGYYICTSSNEVGTESCNITVTVRPPSMNVALYAGIAGGVLAALILVGVLAYCCCCREKDKDRESRPNRSIYLGASREQDEGDDSRPGDQGSNGRQSPDYAGRG
ncbi:cell surface A33 antigen [Saccopteryx bilineata]|uniref:cell surface A33 antigen n=1 Tax=Saccopteryx bilineata TaxID=59482 RepID=UPI00338F676C